MKVSQPFLRFFFKVGLIQLGLLFGSVLGPISSLTVSLPPPFLFSLSFSLRERERGERKRKKRGREKWQFVSHDIRRKAVTFSSRGSFCALAVTDTAKVRETRRDF